MCGIFGVLSHNACDIPEGALSELVSSLFRFSESRGKEASGLAYKCETAIEHITVPQPARRLLRTPRFKGLLARFLGGAKRNPVALLGHCRLATNGSQFNNQNNQPVVLETAAGIHNGIVVNVDALWSKHKELPQRSALDSEFIFSSIAHGLDLGRNLTDVVRDTYAEIQGTATIGMMFKNRSDVVFATNNGSLYFCSAAAGNIALFASEKYILENVTQSSHIIRDIKPSPVVRLGAGAGVSINIDNMAVTYFDVPVSLRGNFKCSDGSARNYDALLREADEIPKLRRCTKCILPETMPFIEFDGDGVCNFCRSYKPLHLKDRSEMTAIFDAKRSKDGSPDCLAAFSGGRDSSFGLHYLAVEAGMHPVAYTYDWGMVNDLARRNQARLCGRLGIEHIVVAADIPKKRRDIRKNIEAWMAKPRLGLIPLFIAGDKQFFYYANKISRQSSLEFIVFCQNKLEKTHFKAGFSGIAPEFKPYSPQAMTAYNKLKLALYYGANFISNPRYLNSSLLDTAFGYFSYYLMNRNYFYLFDYLPWNEKEIERTLVELYDWELAPDSSSSWRIGDGTAPFYNFIYYTVAGFSENDTFRSNQIREGQISRDRALELVQEENRPRYQSIKDYLDLVGLDFDRVIKLVLSMPKLYKELAEAPK